MNIHIILALCVIALPVLAIAVGAIQGIFEPVTAEPYDFL